ncbi:MAG TPA: hypothetical protein VLT86_11125 [Vicinamibacterales bacterium]|nr:hypothetical protein [Vicinamibacterales bacterium]
MASRSKVVDFQEFRAARGQLRLPLSDGPAAPLRELDPPRELNSREVAHRERMLAHLGGEHRQALGTGH